MNARGHSKSPISYYGLDKKYPLGFALFYSVGTRVLYSEEDVEKEYSFDTNEIKMLGSSLSKPCLTGFILNDPRGVPAFVVDDVCVGTAPGSTFTFFRMSEVEAIASSLGVSPHGVASRLAEALIQGDEQGYFADKAYSQAFREALERRGLVNGIA